MSINGKNLKSYKQELNPTELEKFKSLSKKSQKTISNIWAKINSEPSENSFFTKKELDKSIKTLTKEGIKEVSINGKTYELELHNNTKDIGYHNTKDIKAKLILASADKKDTRIIGTIHNDIIIANGYDNVNGNFGDDYIIASNGSTLIGGIGDDTIAASNMTEINSGLNVNYPYTLSPDNDKIFAIHANNIDGGEGEDSLKGRNINKVVKVENDLRQEVAHTFKESPITKEEIKSMPEFSLDKDFNSVEELYNELGLPAKEVNSKRDINKVIAKLEAQGVKEVSVKGKTYELALHANTDFVSYYSEKGNSKFIIATTKNLDAGRLEATQADDIIIANGYRDVQGQMGNDHMNITGTANTYNFARGDEGDDTIYTNNVNKVFSDTFLNCDLKSTNKIFTKNAFLVVGGSGFDSLEGENIKNIARIEEDNRLDR